jgi:chromosome segregation ATPase
VPSGYGNLGTDYAFVESTNYSNIGRVPKNFVGGVKIEEAPEIIPIEDAGRKKFNAIRDLKEDEDRLRDKYGDEYLQASAQARAILEEMYELKSDIDELTRKFENLNCEGRVSPSKLKACNKFQYRINKKVDTYNKKVAEYNALNQPET